MEAKVKKDWFGREKNTVELHENSQEWISEVNFVNDEIKFLENLLSCKYIDCIEFGLEKKVKEIIKKINAERTAGNVLLNSIKDHEIILDKLIETNSVTSNKNYLHTHRMYEKEVVHFLNKYKTLKREIFTLVENVIKKKEQKMIA